MPDTCDDTPWSLAPADETTTACLERTTGLSHVVARILASRGIADADQAQRFLEPSLDRDWSDPSLIPGMDEAADRIAHAIREGEPILVFGDFDLDGISAAAVATRGLEALGATVEAMVPHRFREGYGLTPAAMHRITSRNPSLVVTVDCGISSAAEVATLVSQGIDVVVTDHHEPGEDVPLGIAVANPKLGGESGASRDLAGAGVSLKMVQAVGSRLGQDSAWRELADLAMLGTVADIVPMIGENRALVAAGVAAVRRSPRVPLAALCAVAGVSLGSFSADNVAFAVAPRLNAAGRMADPQIALDLLLTDDPVTAERLSTALDEHNRLRQAAEADLSEAATALAQRVYAGERALVLAGEGWHEGVKGIVASRLAQTYGVPTFLFAIENGVAKGSARSVGTVDLFGAVSACAPLLERYGGHAAAVGLTLDAEKLERFREMLLCELDGLPEACFEAPTTIDAELALADVSTELGAELALLEPFGQANPRPLLAARGVFMNDRGRVGKTANHLRFVAFDGSASVPAIAFSCRDIEQLSECGAAVDLAFQLEVDEWRGRHRAQMIVRDIHVRETRRSPAADLVEDLFAHAEEILAREEYAGIEDAPSFHTKLAGVTFEGRQESIARLAPGVPLRLVRQPDNEFDANACALFDPHGTHVGYLNRRLAAVLASRIDSGVEYDVEITEVTGGGDQAMGLNVVLSRRDAMAEEADVKATRAETRSELGLLTAPELDAQLVSRFIGEGALHAAQVEALDALAKGRNTLAVMATGRGKSLIFHLHAARLALREGAASVFVFPLRALVADQAFHLEEVFAGVGLTVRTVTGESSPSDRDAAFSTLSSGELDVVLTTPEFLQFHVGRFASTGKIRFLVVDEAHHVGLSRAGHRPAYARLGEAVDALSGPTVLAVTATASDEVAASIRDSLAIEHLVLDPTVRENLAIEDHRSCTAKDELVATLAATGEKAVIYVNSRDASVRLARMLRKRVPGLAWHAAFYNGGLSRSVRHAVERAFRAGDVRVVVATSAFGEGVNIPDIRNVVLYHLPFNDVEFNQMAGRVGRDGAMGRVHLLFGDKDARINERILASSAPDREDLATLYRVLQQIASSEGEGFEITNAELAQRCAKMRRGCALDDRGVSSGVGVFRELGLVVGEGHGAYRRLTLIPSVERVELAQSVRYAEGLDEIAEFRAFREWAMSSAPDELLSRFNRPILPTRVPI